MLFSVYCWGAHLEGVLKRDWPHIFHVVFLLQICKRMSFFSQNIEIQKVYPFWTKLFGLCIRRWHFCIFTLGAEAAFCGSPVRYLILRQVCRNKEIPEKFLKLPRFVRRYFFYILREHFSFLLWPNCLSPLLLIWLHTDCCLSAMATEPASSLLNLSPPLHTCPPIKISGCKQVIFFAAICFMGLKISG